MYMYMYTHIHIHVYTHIIYAHIYMKEYLPYVNICYWLLVVDTTGGYDILCHSSILVT